jgi:hypothetical protein
MRKIFCYLAALLLFSTTAYPKEMIQLPTEELARESVSPVFDINDSVRNRNIVTKEKFEGAIFYGWALTEPIANVSKLGVSGYYHRNEEDAYGLMFYEELFRGFPLCQTTQ